MKSIKIKLSDSRNLHISPENSKNNTKTVRFTQENFHKNINCKTSFTKDPQLSSIINISPSYLSSQKSRNSNRIV